MSEPAAIVEQPPSSARRTVGVAAVTAGTLVVVAAGAFAAVHVFSGGPRAESALPAADTLVVVSLDLDPSARQKVEALKTFDRFPALKKELGLSSTGDLRKKFFDEVLDHGDCKRLSYDADVKPWIGDNAAVAAASFEKGKVSPLLALSVTDEAKAKQGLSALLACDSGGSKAAAFAFHDGFALVSDSQAHADRAARDADDKALSDDAGYQEWTGKVGDRGVANFYVAKAAAGYLAHLPGLAGGLPGGLPDGLPGGMPGGMPGGPNDLASLLPSGEGVLPSTSAKSAVGASAPYAAAHVPAASPRALLAKFTGAAGALRFADGGAELEVASGGLGKAGSSSDASGDPVTGLPGDTAAALGFAVPRGVAERLLSMLGGLGGTLLGGQLGITLPEDLTSLLGRGLSVSVRGTPPADLAGPESAKQVPAGVTILGDPAKIKAVIAKLEASQGRSLADSGIAVQAGAGKVTLSFDSGYAKALLGKGDLGANDSFRQVVPDADKASAIAYVDFDSPWRETIAKTLQSKGQSKGQSADASKDFLANTAPLKALGFSGWSDAGVSHLLLKVTTD